MLRDFLDWGRRTRGWAETTCYGYGSRINRWLDYCTQHGIRPNRATARDMEAWLTTIPQTPAARSCAVTALIAYYDWRQALSGRDNPARGLPRIAPRRVIPRSLTPEQVATLRAVAQRHGPKWTLFTKFMLYAGLRRAEACQVRWIDIEGADEWLRVLGKGGIERVIPIHPTLRNAIVRWRTSNPSPVWVFPGRWGQPMSINTATMHMRRILDEAGLPQATGHWLRHTYATRMIERGATVPAVSAALGHRSLASTTIYTRARDGHLREAVGLIDY